MMRDAPTRRFLPCRFVDPGQLATRSTQSGIPIRRQDASVRDTGDPVGQGDSVRQWLRDTPGTRALGNCELTPGLYVFAGDFELAGNASIEAKGIAFLFTCRDGTAPRDCAEGEASDEIPLSGSGDS